MKKKLLALLSAVASLALLAGCGGGGNSTGGGSTDTGSTDTGSSTPCEHVYDNDCDADCNECGETRTPAEHSYTVANKDDTHHWNECACGAVDESSKAEHAFENACDTDCECGYERVTQHEYTVANKDAEYHWNECACGAVDESSKAEHAYTEAKKDDTHHWNECTCGAVDEASKAEHAFENACDTDCECGYERVTQHDYTAVPKGYFPAKEVVTGKYLLVADGLYMADALSESKNYGYLYSDENAPAEGAYKTVDETNVFTITKVDGGYTIQDTYGRYLYNTGTYNNFSLAASDAEVTEDHLWTIVIADDGTATITDVSTGKMVQQGEGTYTSYGVYAEKKDDTAMPVLYLYQEGNVKSDATDHWFACNVCGEASAKEAHKGGEATCIKAAVCEVCGMSYGEPTGEHEYTVANKDAEYHWNQCICGAAGEKTAHVYNVVDSTNAKYDVAGCECGQVSDGEKFYKTVSIYNQELSATAETNAILLSGVSEYASVKSVKLGDYDLGADIANLVFPAELKADTKSHGKQTLVVTVVDANGAEHAVKVPVTIITKTIGTLEELQSIQPTEAAPAVYGYYVLTANIANTGLASSSYVDPNWSTASGFFGTLDGAGYYIQMAQNGETGLFGTMRNATLKNITIKEQWSSKWNGARLLGAAAYGCTFENVEIVCLGGGNPNMNVGVGSGYLFSAEFSNNVVRNMTITVHTSGQGNVFGGKFYGNKFENVVVNGTYTELAYCPEIKDGDGNVVYAEKTYKTPADVETLSTKKVTLAQQVVDMSAETVSGIDLKEYANATIVNISASNGYSFNGLASEFMPTDVKMHGEITLSVTVMTEGNEEIVVVIPVIIATQTLSTMQELYDVVKLKSGVAVDGCYLLTADVSDTEAGFTVGSPSNYEWQSGTGGFCGTLIGATKEDGSKYTVSFVGSNLKHGLFTTVRNATIKNIKFVNTEHNDGWNNSVIGYTAFNTTFENVDFEIISTKVSTDYGVLVGSHMGGCTWKNVTVKSAQAHSIIFKTINDANNVDTFENFTVEVLSLEKFSNTVADAPAGVTVTETGAAA